MKTQIDNEINKIESLISTARKLLSRGEISDFCALEKRVNALCCDAKNLKNDGNSNVLPKLNNIMTEMDDLAIELKNIYGWLCLVNSSNIPADAKN